MYIPKYFKLYEWLPKKFYEANIDRYGNNLWRLFDDRILKSYDQIRERFGKITMNDWRWGGRNQYRGWRPFECEIGALLSQHKFGKAGDGIPGESSLEDVRNAIIDKEFEFITAVELTVPWLHVDCREHDTSKGLLLF